MPDWLKTVALKLLAVDTCAWYEVAPDEALHCKSGVIDIPVALLAGEDRVGDEGGVPPPPPLLIDRSSFVIPPLANTYVWAAVPPTKKRIVSPLTPPSLVGVSALSAGIKKMGL
jgi:hypothetical protein